MILRKRTRRRMGTAAKKFALSGLLFQDLQDLQEEV